MISFHFTSNNIEVLCFNRRMACHTLDRTTIIIIILFASAKLLERKIQCKRIHIYIKATAAHTHMEDEKVEHLTIYLLSYKIVEIYLVGICVLGSIPQTPKPIEFDGYIYYLRVCVCVYVCLSPKQCLSAFYFYWLHNIRV